MPVRRPFRAMQRVQKAVMETLEPRRLLTSVINGVFENGSNTFEYRDAGGQIVRIVVNGDITAEFIGMRTRERGSETQRYFVDLVPPNANNQQEGVDLFHIHIARGDADGFIAIATVPELTATPRPMQPFSGTSGTIRVRNASTGQELTTNSGSGSGGVWIGARTLDTIDNATFEQDIPILSHPLNRPFGVMPQPANNRLGAGISSGSGVNIGKILIGGTVTGNVYISGSIDTFYAGAVLTGDATGQSAISAPTINDNFFVGGDIRNLAVMNGIGTTDIGDLQLPEYRTGFDMKVGGKLGHIRAQNTDFWGAVEVVNNTIGWRNAIQELEFRDVAIPSNSSLTFFQLGFIGDHSTHPDFHNDSYDNPQYINAYFSNDIKEDNAAIINGSIDSFANVGDDNDYYALPLMAGQVVSVKLETLVNVPRTTANPTSILNIGVFDPDGRLIATDYHNVGRGENPGLPFQFTADRPGVYRIAVGLSGDLNFTTAPRSVAVNYRITLRNLGRLALGGVTAAQTIYTSDDDISENPQFNEDTGQPIPVKFDVNSFTVRNGDMGAIVSGGHILNFSEFPYLVVNGDLRTIQSGSIGLIVGGAISRGIDLSVRGGSVGLMRTTAADGVMDMNFGHFDFLTGNVRTNRGVGRDYQMIDAANIMSGDLVANRGIGVIRARQIGASNYAPSFVVNADRKGNDGVIDLIEATDNIGSPGAGGPKIFTGPGGNVRYMYAGGTIFVDAAFGGGTPQVTEYRRGEVVRLVDDSGTDVELRAIPLIPNPNNTSTDPQNAFIAPGQLIVETYPIRGDLGAGQASGVVITRVRVEPGVGGVGRGLEVRSGGRGAQGSVEIGQVFLHNNGTQLIWDQTQVSPFPGVPGGERGLVQVAGGQPNDVLLTGASTVDVYSIVSRDLTPAQNLSGIVSIVNDTDGEIVNVDAQHIGGISAETIGLAKSYTGTVVEGQQIRSDLLPAGGDYPFLQQRNLVWVRTDGGPGTQANIGSLRARRGMGNIVAEGIIDSVVADSNRRNVGGVFEGINAPILALPTSNTGDVRDGRINFVNIGEGIASSGSGAFSRAGLYAGDRIGRVVGVNADIRGEIVAGPMHVLTGAGVVTDDTFTIGTIELTNGSIINSAIGVAGGFNFISNLVGGLGAVETNDTFTDPRFDIEGITINGNGGIIGSMITAPDIGMITINGGFGFINSDVRTSGGDGVAEGIITDGYGIRDSWYEGGASIRTVAARGNGTHRSITNYSASARPSERGEFDPETGLFAHSPLIDLYAALNTTPANPRPKGWSKDGIIADSLFQGSRDLGTMQAWQIQSRRLIYLQDPNDANRQVLVQPGNIAFPMRITFGNSIGSIVTRSDIIGMSAQAGQINSLQVGGNLERAAVAGTGRVIDVNIKNTMKGTSSIMSFGPEGQIGNVTIGRGMFGRIGASTGIGTVRVGGDLGSPSLESSRNIALLEVGRHILDGAYVRARNQLGTLRVGGDIKPGAVITAKSLGQPPEIEGDLLGQLIIG